MTLIYSHPPQLKFIEKDSDWLFMQMQAHNLSEKDLGSITLAAYNQQGMVEFDTTNEKEKNKGVYNYKPGNEN